MMEARIGRFLGAATLLSVGLLALGSVLLLAAGHSPLDPGPGLDPAQLVRNLRTTGPAALLWAGVLVVVVTPAARVAAALAGYVAGGERGMALVASLVLVVIAVGVIAGTLGA